VPVAPFIGLVAQPPVQDLLLCAQTFVALRQTFVRRCHGGLGSDLSGIGNQNMTEGQSAFGVFRGSKSKAPPLTRGSPAVHWQIDFLVALPPVQDLLLCAKYLFISANQNMTAGRPAFGAGEVFRGSKTKAPRSSPAGALCPCLRLVILRQRFVCGSHWCQFCPCHE
jgi:hypothetical protein